MSLGLKGLKVQLFGPTVHVFQKILGMVGITHPAVWV